MDSKSKEIYEYIVRKEDHWCIISFLFILFGLFGAAYVHTIIILIICVITGGIIIIPAIKSPFDAKKKLKGIKSTELFEELYSDFISGTQFFEDRITVGDTFVIGAKTNGFVKIADISNVWIHIIRVNGAETLHEIKVLENGKECTLGYMTATGYKGSDCLTAVKENIVFKDLLSQLLSINSKIQLGI